MAEQVIITRTHVIVVNEVGQNAYNDLTFTDQQGGQYKISAKRRQYFDNVIAAGTAVQLNYAMSSFGKEYVYSATQVKDGLPPPKQAQPHPTAQVPAQDMPPATAPPKRLSDTKNRAFALSYAKDIYVARIAAGKLDFKTSNILAVASVFSRWLDGDDTVKQVYEED